jgi:Right handed beta helix region
MPFRLLLWAALVSCATSCSQSPPMTAALPSTTGETAASRASGTFVIGNTHHHVYTGLNISTRSGDCVRIEHSTDITIERSQIGPCGGNGVSVSGGRFVRIYDSYIHPETRSKGCCDHNDGVLVENVSDVIVTGNVIAYGESNIEAPQGVSDLSIAGNFLLNPRGPFPRGQNVQTWNVRRIVVRKNYTMSSPNTRRYLYPDDQEDSINFGLGKSFKAEDNYVTGGESPSGCGIIADDGANGVEMLGNVLVDTGACGIGIASGIDQIVKHNRVINRNPVKGGGNTAIYVWNQYQSVPCGPVRFVSNVATELRKDGSQSGFWDGGGCSPVAKQRNIWNEPAYKLLTPVREKLPPPEIPPQPKSCVIESPYSTQTKWPSC